MDIKIRRFILCYLLIFATGTMGLTNTKIKVPPIVKTGDTVVLACTYDLEKGPLYTIKWYLNDQEFYRYVFQAEQPKNSYPVGDLKIDISASDNQTVTLLNVSRELTGLYKCEISEDYPSYHTAILELPMEVAEIPDKDPEILVERSHLSSDDTLRANCTSGAAHPAPNITWTFNGDPITKTTITHRQNATIDRKVKSWSGLQLKLSSGHFREGQLRLRCIVTIKGLYTATAEEVITEDKPLIASITGGASPQSHRASGCDTIFFLAAPGVHHWTKGLYLAISIILLNDLCR